MNWGRRATRGNLVMIRAHMGESKTEMIGVMKFTAPVVINLSV